MARILIADDEPKVRRILQMALERAGHEVIAAANGQAALAELHSCLPDALITDIEMPRMNGRQLCEAIYQDFPERTFPIFVVTSLAEREHRGWASTLPNLTFMEKPISARMLLAQLAASLPSTPAAVSVS
jgi:CheY-like chemotaxis protein